jgi:hypothetical protein
MTELLASRLSAEKGQGSGDGSSRESRLNLLDVGFFGEPDWTWRGPVSLSCSVVSLPRFGKPLAGFGLQRSFTPGLRQLDQLIP